MRRTSRQAFRIASLIGLAALAGCPEKETGPTTKPAVAVISVQGSGQSAIAGAAVATSPKIKVVDEDGTGVGGATFHFYVTAGGGTVSTSSGTVGADGTASAGTWTLGTTAGPNTVSAVVDGVGVPVEFSATGIAGPAATITVNGGANQTAAAGAAVATPPSVKVVDANNNAVANATVTFAVTAGGGSVTGGTPTTNTQGLATVGSWTLGTAGTNTLSATVAGVSAISISATATPVASKLVMGTQPGNAITGQPIGTQPVVTIRDAANSIVTGSAAAVTATIGSGTGTLSGTSTVNAVNGTATFTNLVVTGTSAVTLTFTSPGLTSVTSNSFTPASSVGPAAKLSIHTQPANAVTGVAFGVQPVIVIRDANDIAVTTSTAAVTAAIASGTGTLSGTTTVAAVGGTASFTNLAVTGTSAVTLSFSATGLAGATSNSFTPSAVAPAAVAINGGNNQSATAGSAVTTAPSVKVTDAGGNALSGITVTFAVTAGGGSITGATPTTNASGIATVGGWTLGTTAGANTLTATVTGITPVTFGATGLVGAATKLVVTTQPANVVSGQPIGTPPVITIRDANNNLVTTAGHNVVVQKAGGAGTVSGTTTVPAVNGVATFTGLIITGTTSISLGFAAIGLTGTESDFFTPAATAPFNLVIDGMHLTQATQSYAGTVPIVAGRAALARVFVRATATNTSTPAVRLRTYQNGSLFKTYTITAPASAVPVAITEGTLASSWNVAIPANEVVANMSILADVDPTNAVTESSETDNTFPTSGTALTLDVRTVPTMKITFIPVTQGGGTGDISAANLNAYLDYPNRVYPWAAVDAVIAPTPYTFSQTLSGTSYTPTWPALLSEIAAKRTADGITDRYYYAVVKPSYSSGGTGWGSIGGPYAIGIDVKFNGTVQPGTNYYSMTLAHELGHNFGRNHVNCGSPSNPDNSYPYSPTSSIGVYGYDPVNNVLRAPDSHVDFMSYCQPLWISDYTYKAVITWRSTTFAPPAQARRSLLVWGRIGPSGITLEPAFEIDAPPQLPARAGRYSVQAMDATGRQVFSISFDGFATDHDTRERTFSFAVPLPASGDISELRLLDGAQVMARRPRTTLAAAAPEALASMRMRALGAARPRLEWNAQAFPMAMVRDPVTGEVIAFARGGSVDVGTARTEVDVLFSNGVSSVRRRVSITPR